MDNLEQLTGSQEYQRMKERLHKEHEAIMDTLKQQAERATDDVLASKLSRQAVESLVTPAEPIESSE